MLSDSEKEILDQYGVWLKKKMFGREFMGVVRSTFLIDPEGRIAHIWKRVRVKDHAEKVFNKLVELQEA